MPNGTLPVAFGIWQIRICVNFTPSNEHSIQKSSSLRLSLYQTYFTLPSMAVVAQSEYPFTVTTLPRC